MRPDTTRTISDQVINRRYKDQLVPASDMELDNYLDSIDSELKQPFRIKAALAPGSYTINVESIIVANPETFVNRSRFPIGKKIPDFAGATITFPNTTGNPVLVSAGLAEDLDIPNDQYAKVLVQINDQGELFLRQGFSAATAADAEIPKAKSGLTSIGFITLHMGVGGVLDQISEEDITQFQGQNDTQDFYESMRMRERRSDYKTVEITSADYLGTDDNLWSRTIEGKKLRFDGAVINFETGNVFAADGSTPLGANFAPVSLADTFWNWYSVNIVPTVVNADNEMQAELLIVPASVPGTSINDAPKAPWADHDKAIRIGQVAVQGTAVPGEIALIFDANIIHKAELSSEGEGRRFGVADVTALKDIPLYERHHHMLRLVESDLQGRGVLYRWDEFDTSLDTTADPEIGEAPKVAEPTDGVGRWKTITAMDIGESVVRTDMIRDDSITLAKLIHTDPHRVIGFNATGVPSYLFELELTDGSAAQPTYSFALDQDTGWYRQGDGAIAWSSNGVRKFNNTWDGSNDYFEYGGTTSSKNHHLRVTALDSYIAYLEAYGEGGTSGAGQLFIGQDITEGGGIMYNGDDIPTMAGRVDSVAFYRRSASVETEVFWYRPTNNNVHFNGCIALKDNDGLDPNPEPGYLALCQDNDSIFMKTSGGTVINVPNQDEADLRYLKRNASDTPTLDNTWDLGTGALRWANIYAVTFRGRATSANYADLAERYEADKPMEPGDLVKIGGEKEVTKTTKSYDTEVFGVVSTQPGFILNDYEGDSDSLKPPVAFSGRVPCKVVGKVRRGQRLCSSDIEGVAQVVNENFDSYKVVIGRALEDKEYDEVGKIEVVVGTK